MKVRDIMAGRPVFVFPETETVEAARLMRRLEIGALPVCIDGRVVGIVTDRDIVVRYVADGGRTKLVGSIMTLDPVFVGPDDSVELAEALMAEHRVRRLPVCDGDRLVGLVSVTDLARHVSCTEVGAVVEAMGER